MTATIPGIAVVLTGGPSLRPGSNTVVIDSLVAISPLLEKVEGESKIGNTIHLTYDNDFKVADTASKPAMVHGDLHVFQEKVRKIA